METLWKVINSCILGLFVFQLCNGLPINLETTATDSHTQLLTGLVAVLLTVCSVVFLAGCLCCQRRNGFKEFRDSPVVASASSNLDHGIINPVANGEFTIFTPLSPPHQNNNIFLANEQIITRTKDDYSHGDVDVSSWFSETERDFPRNKLKYIREIGKGWFGQVVEGTAQNINNDQKWTSVVVRILEATASSSERVVFLHDAEIYRCGIHPNILQLHGRCLDTIPLLLLQEYCPQGDLKKYLLETQSDCSKLLSSEYPLVWCCQLTSALKHLHDNKLIHPDLAARNCQLTRNFLLQLGDYGLSIYQYPNDYYQGLPGVSVRWCAPETIECTSTTIKPKKLTFESNIWTLGVTMWEIFECGQQPYKDFNDDEVISKVLGTFSNIKLNRPSYPLLYTDYIYRLMQLCWTSSESRPTISQIDLMLTDLLQVYKNTNSVSIEDFDKRWESLKPNTIVKTDNHQVVIDCSEITDTDSEITISSKPLSPSLNNLHGSLNNLLNDNQQEMESWLENVATKTGDLSYVKGLSEAMKNLDNTLALENTSSSESSHQSPVKQKLEFKLGPCGSNSKLDSLTDHLQRNSSGSETEDENWKQKVERGVYSEKVRQKSRSVTDLMILTHIDYSESESETPLPSLDYRTNFNKNPRLPKTNLENTSLMYGSEGSLLNILDKNFQNELKKLQDDRKDSLLFVPDECSQNLDCSTKKTNKDEALWGTPSHKRILQELNNTSELKPASQVFNVFNVTIDKFSPVHVNAVNLNEIIHYEDGRFYQVPKLSDIIQNSAKFAAVFRNSETGNSRFLKNGLRTKNCHLKITGNGPEVVKVNGFNENNAEHCLDDELDENCGSGKGISETESHESCLEIEEICDLKSSGNKTKSKIGPVCSGDLRLENGISDPEDEEFFTGKNLNGFEKNNLKSNVILNGNCDFSEENLEDSLKNVEIPENSPESFNGFKEDFLTCLPETVEFSAKYDCKKESCDQQTENSKVALKNESTIQHIEQTELHQVPKLMDIIQNNDELMDYIIAKYDDKSSDNSLDYEELERQNSENCQAIIQPTKDLHLNETEKPKIAFDLSDNQTEILPNPLTHSNVFASTPFGKKSFQDITVNLQQEAEFSSLNLFSQKIEGEQCDNKNLYSLETWDNFLGKALDDQENGFFDSFTTEPQSLLFIQECNESHPENILFDDESQFNKTFTISEYSDAISEDLNTTFVIDKSLESDKSLNDNWTNGGWFLHPQTNNDVTGEMTVSENSDSYVGFNMDDEIMAAIRHELLTKLPQAQGVSSDKSCLDDEEDLDLLEKNEVFLRYNVYNTPLSPIPEESLMDDHHQTRQKESEDSDSDWSERCEPDLSPKLQHRHTPSQDSCCSNDTLFNLEELVINEMETQTELSKKNEMKMSENYFSASEREACCIKIVTEDSTDSTATENLLPFNKQVAPLPSPEDKPWKQLAASLLSFDKISQTNAKLLPENDNKTVDENVYDIYNEADYINIVNMENTKNSAEYLNNKDVDDDSSKSPVNSLIISDNGTADDDNDVFGVLTDIRFNGPSDNQLMSTSFSESNDLNDEQDWDSGSDTRSSSSGEFIWKMDDVKPMEEIQEETSSESSDEEGESPDFVPSAWDKYATPTKSALRSPEKTLEKTEKKKTKGVWFKKQKYHCIYEYPREPESPNLNWADFWVTPHINAFANWEFDASDSVLASEAVHDDFSQNFYQPKTRNNFNLYQLSSIQDFSSSSSSLDDEFFISGSAKPFDMVNGVSSQFFPGSNWTKDNTTPDSGVEDITPNEYPPTMHQVQSLKLLASNVVKRTNKKVEEPTMMGGLRHTRDKLKLDLPPSPSAFTTTNKIFNLEMDLEPPIVIREKPEFTTFGKSRFFVQQVDTPPDCDQSTKNVSFEALPYKPVQKHIFINDNSKGKVEVVRGEASLLDSADEDSGIESSTLERKVVV